MPMNKEFLAGFFEGVENADERIEKILKEHEADTTGGLYPVRYTQLSGVP